jgi:16S rRNA (uracil1498-N3)-methyltransferase
MQLFYTPDINPSGIPSIFLAKRKASMPYACCALRLAMKYNLIDGRGGLYTARINDAHP